MKKISGPALKAVMDDEIKFYPAKFKNLYRHWMENIKDWCITASYGGDIGYRHGMMQKEIYCSCDRRRSTSKIESIESNSSHEPMLKLKQDEDCLDTWFSSWLWPFEVFKGYRIPAIRIVKYYYPTNTLVTAPEIIFFWVARMIMAGFEYKDEKPFSEVYFTGIVRDKREGK